LPTWVSHIDGWENKDNIKPFIDYVDLVVKELGGDIDYWIVLNEPMMHVYGSYLKAYHPPQKRSLILAEKAFRNLVQAQNQAHKLIHGYFPPAKVGCANMLNFFEPADSWNPLEKLISKGAHYYWNQRFLDKTSEAQDFIGVNYYYHDRIVWYPPFRANRNEWADDRGQEIYPEGIYQVLKFAGQYGKPVIITENGLADSGDEDRARFIKEHLRYVHRALDEGVEVLGYMHWSLLDNFEWSHGWQPKFGLYALDRETFERTPRPSAEEYGKICKENAVEVKIS
jgi:beta-glucosidase